MKIKKISIIVPCFNGGLFLEDSIKSIIKQTFNNFKLYLINNGSTDNSLKIMRFFERKDNRIIVINHRKKTSKGRSINKILRKIPEKYVCLMDADDIMLKSKLLLQIKYLQKNPDIKVLSSLSSYISDGKKSAGMSVNLLNNHNSCFDLIKNEKNVGLASPGVIIDRQVINSIGGFRDKFWPCDDIDLWNRVSEAGYKVYAIPKILLKYRLHKDSVITSTFLRSKMMSRWVKECLILRLKKKREVSYKKFIIKLKRQSTFKKIQIYSQDYSDYYFRNMIIHIIDNNYLKIFYTLLLAFLINPIRIINKIYFRIVFKISYFFYNKSTYM
jgi:glycosyltransferase involved in cell wall biosynthesis